MNYSDFVRNQCFVDGIWCDADQGGTISVTDPATGETITTVPQMGAAETARAIAAAEAALPAWRAKTAGERAKILRKLFDLMIANQDALGELLSREQGKPLAEAKGEIGLWCQLRRMVRRRGQARLWRSDPRPRCPTDGS
jgi:succinate-semialdehyde dehydrogenase/glutarate-semialdehyde dehydrogenase